MWVVSTSLHLSKVMKNFIVRFTAAVSVIFLFSSGVALAKESRDLAQQRNQIIGYMLDKQLPAIHFGDKKMDKSLSEAAFHLYLKQLDYQKRFLLKNDVQTLRSFAPHISDNLEHGTMVLPDASYNIMKERVAQVEKMVEKIMAHGFDVNRNESFETDPKKLTYADNLVTLQERWRKIMKFQVMTKYIELMEDQAKAKTKVPDKKLWKKAMDEVEKVNKDFFLRLHQKTLQDFYDQYFNAIANAFDPHTDYLAPEKKQDFDIHMRGSLEGIGALLREEDGFIKVVRIIPGSPAAKQGQLQAEDTILQVAEKGGQPVDITDMPISDAVRLIRGPKGTEVRLTVKKPDGAKQVIPIVRGVVQIQETFVKHEVITSPDGGKIGYILIPSFYRDFEKPDNGDDARNATDDTRKAIDALKKTKLEGMILDLRNNGGGSLIDAVDIAGLFIGSGPVVQVKNTYGTIRVLDDDDDGVEYKGPLLVLVNQLSASASEIVTAALQDYKRAVIVGGAHTFGKGTVQTLIDLNENLPLLQVKKIPDLGALKVTIQKFYRVTGASTQYKGVTPDIILPSLFEHLKIGEKYLDDSLPWDQVKPADFTPWNGKPLDLPYLKKRSKERVAHEEGLKIIAEEAQKATERSKKTMISLKLSNLRKKMDEDQREREAIGAQFRKYQERMGEGNGSELGGKKGKKDVVPNWREDVKHDPYINEAKKIIVDMEH